MNESARGWEKRLAGTKPLGMQRELLQITAMLTMLIDHIGVVLFPEYWWLRVIGRISFPLYAFGIVQGYQYSRDIGQYIRRLGLLAILSQVPYILAFNLIEINVIATLFVCICVLYGMDRTSQTVWKILLACGAFVLMNWIPMDYGSYALILILIYRYAPSNLSVLFHFLLNMAFWLTVGVAYQHFSVVSTAWLAAGTKKAVSIKVPRWLWLSFYPAHLLLLFVIKRLW